MLEDEDTEKRVAHHQSSEGCLPIDFVQPDQPKSSIDKTPTDLNFNAIHKNSLWSEPGVQNSWTVDDEPSISDMLTWVLPYTPLEQIKKQVTSPNQALRVSFSKQAPSASTEGSVQVLLKLVKSSGIYALSSVAGPLISLILAPFLTHQLSTFDYGVLALTNTTIGLMVGITQLGLASAFFRAYSYDYSSQQDRRSVVSTVTTLLSLVSILATTVVVLTAPWLARFLFVSAALGNDIALAGGVILLQNLTVPGMAWLRAEDRPFLYSLLSISNLVITLLSTIFLVGVLHWGVPGAIVANGAGFAFVVICTIPVLLIRAGIKLRTDIAQNVLAFGLPLVLNFISYWILQLSDRYLLGLFASLVETARYSVVYTLGSTMSVVIISPFTLAWPSMMFSIAKRNDAVQVFKLVFRWFSMLLFFVAFGFTLVTTFLLDWLFPAAYHSAALVIPLVAESMAFYGVYYIFMAGANIQRKTWLAGVFTTIAAVVNLALNLVLIPLYGAMGAATSTLVAYVILSLAAYIVNQRIYPIPFEMGRFTAGLLIGVGLYVGSNFLARAQGTYVAWGIYFTALILYGGCLALIGRLPSHRLSKERE